MSCRDGPDCDLVMRTCSMAERSVLEHSFNQLLSREYVCIYIYIWARAAGRRTPPANGMVWISVRGVGFEILEIPRKTNVLLSEVPEILKIQRKIIVFEGLRFQNIENPN